MAVADLKTGDGVLGQRVQLITAHDKERDLDEAGGGQAWRIGRGASTPWSSVLRAGRGRQSAWDREGSKTSADAS
jgi:hypothetical protein